MIKLVALDLDGTFYAGRTLGIPASAWAAIERGRASGLKFAVCTGRPQGGHGLQYAQGLQPDGPHVFNDGASICDAWGRSLHAEPVPRLQEIVAIARKNGLPFDLMGADNGRYYESELMPPELLTHIEMTGVVARSAAFENIRETLVRLWFVVPDLSLWETVKPDLEALPEIDLAEYLSPREVITGVIKKGISKSSGLSWLAGHYGVSLEEIAMIGDSHNDLEAIRDAGLGIAMGNAVDEILAVADHITGHVRENGFAQAIEHVLALNRRG
ncbi:HAD-IIB family hydrolase [uncultured Meiothermus sp.]|jgi:Cof subfamily protein (haloacid dehalogenase superfamily)|uniref:HAD-IIB family hydrolase n=1 Tax=uncultured Meiothermus sp. TaxID=157471 RepID=UPI0026171641|nr:HAD-IIB family hydrolase [uncultured Meiothermus sp.]